MAAVYHALFYFVPNAHQPTLFWAFRVAMMTSGVAGAFKMHRISSGAGGDDFVEAFDTLSQETTHEEAKSNWAYWADDAQFSWDPAWGELPPDTVAALKRLKPDLDPAQAFSIPLYVDTFASVEAFENEPKLTVIFRAKD